MRINRLWLSMMSLLLVISAVAGCSSTSSTGAKASTEDTLTIGAVFPLTGTSAPYGVMSKQGVDLAVEEINKNGGIAGKKLIVEYEDGRGEPKASVQSAQTLTAKDIPLILSATTGVTLAILPIAERNKKTVFNGGGQGDDLAGASPYLFNTIPLLGLEVEVLTRYLNEEMPDSKKVFVIYVDDDSGRSGLKKFTEEFTGNGGEIVGSGSHKPGETNYRAIITKAKSTNPDLIYLASHGQDAKLTIDQIQQLGVEAKIVSTSWTIIPEITNSPNSEGLIHTSLAFNPDEEWLADFKEKFGTDQVSNYAANYYDAVKIFAKAYEHAVEKEYGTDGVAIAKAIADIQEFESANGTIRFNDDGTSVRQIDISIIKDNESKLIKSY